MATINALFIFKGDEFVNRYRITGTLTAKSPLHIGTGERREDNEINEKDKTEEKRYIDNIARDFNKSPYVPGSTLRGAVRNYLFQIFRSISPQIATIEDYEAEQHKNRSQQEKIDFIQNDACLLDQLFGTPFHESKIDFWDASLKKKIDGSELVTKGWDYEKQSYVMRSVAIDPQTGAAEPNKLYSFDVAPKGIEFQVNIVGQNLSEVELGFLFFGLNGFNSEILPLTIGAMSGRGFGQMAFNLEEVYRLEKSDLPNWANIAQQHNHAGFNSFYNLESKIDAKMIASFKNAFIKTIR